MMQQATAKLRYLRMSPRKVRLQVDMIRGKKAHVAINELAFSKQVSAKPVLKLLKSAIANAKTNHGLKEETLVIKSGFVNGGPIAYRWMPRAMGRATPIRRRTAHITLVLEGEVDSGKMKAVEEPNVEATNIEEKTNKDVKAVKTSSPKKRTVKKAAKKAVAKK